MKKIFQILKNKGLIETFIYGMSLLYVRIFSYLKILLLRIRGYSLDFSVILKGNNFFFQSTKKAVSIGKKTIIGKHTRISAGGRGKVEIGMNVLIDDFTFVMAHEKIEIGDNTKIAAFCFLTDFNHKFNDFKKSIKEQGYETKPVKIGRNVWIGTHSIILPGVAIGDNSVIGAGSVVTKNIPSRSIAVGNPAKVIKKL